MSRMRVNGINLFVSDRGEGTPIIFVHEFGGDHRSWQKQVDAFSRSYRCIVYAARGYPPSDVPDNQDAYGWQIAVDDLAGVISALQLDKAFIVGLSMGAYTGLMFAMQCPGRVSGLVFASGGTGSNPDTRDRFIADARAMADQVVEMNSTDLPGFLEGPSRIQLQNKNQSAWREFTAHFKEHAPLGTAMTLNHVQAERPSLYDFEDQLSAMAVPTLLLAGDEDEHVLDVNLWLKRTMPYAGLRIFSKTGHLLNLEEPEQFNQELRRFIKTVTAEQWNRRDPRSELTAKV